MRKLIVQPLKESGISTVIIIDALDECRDDKPASAILSVLGEFIHEIPRVKFLITGRPEPRISEGFRSPLLAGATDVFVLHQVEPRQVADDILLFFRHRLSGIADRWMDLDDWPTKEELDLLGERAAGFFLFAVATVMFIDKPNAHPRKQLGLLQQSPWSSVFEGMTALRGGGTLDSFYTLILHEAFGDDDPDDDPKVRSVLGAVTLTANPLSPSTIAVLLGLDALEDVLPRLLSAKSLLILKEDINSPVLPFHTSFPGFLVDPDRCKNKRFCVSPPVHHSEFLTGCLDLMNQTLEGNMCKLPDRVSNSDVSDLMERVGQYIDPALRYACMSWHTHLVGGYATFFPAAEITLDLHRFLETKFVFWLEVLSVLGAVRNAVDALQAAADWLEVRLHSIFGILPRYAQT